MGTTRRRISRKNLGKVIIPLPPLAEQKRIAGILDAADALRAKRREALVQLDTLLQSTFLDMFGDPVTNPLGWEVRGLKETKSRVQIGPFGSLLHKEDYIVDGVPLVNPMHIVSGQIRVGNKQTVSEQKAASLGNYRLESGDVVMGRRGEMVGVPSFLTLRRECSAVPDRCFFALIRVNYRHYSWRRLSPASR